MLVGRLTHTLPGDFPFCEMVGLFEALCHRDKQRRLAKELERAAVKDGSLGRIVFRILEGQYSTTGPRRPSQLMTVAGAPAAGLPGGATPPAAAAAAAGLATHLCPACAQHVCQACGTHVCTMPGATTHIRLASRQSLTADNAAAAVAAAAGGQSPQSGLHAGSGAGADGYGVRLPPGRPRPITLTGSAPSPGELSDAGASVGEIQPAAAAGAAGAAALPIAIAGGRGRTGGGGDDDAEGSFHGGEVHTQLSPRATDPEDVLSKVSARLRELGLQGGAASSGGGDRG